MGSPVEVSPATGVVDGIGRVFGSVSLAHQTCLQLEDVLRAALDDIHPMTTTKSHNRTPSAATTGTSDGDNPQSMVIVSLRGQVSDLVSQVTQLNSKLVQSYDRISDLEDNMHITSSTLRNSTLKISQLELERTQHLSALNTGLLVEKSHVTAELTRLMEKATDEAAQRGMAESARQEIEKDLDDLSAELFGRANTMVAEARLAQAKSERRVQDAEGVLKGAEEAVGSMQAQMQALREEKDRTDRELAQMREVMGKGKWVERERSSPSLPLKLLSTHVPYQEFLLFVAHLRQIRPVTPQVPPMATLLPLPFLARLVSEDSDPTLRLDSAPSLNWLTRRSVISAIHQSQLTVEPLSMQALLELFAPNASAAMSAFATYSTQVSVVTQQQQPINITCALCGKSVISSSVAPASHTPVNGTVTSTGTNSWRPAFFSKSSNGTPTKQNSPAIHSPTPSVATSISFYPPSNSSGPGRLSPPPTPPLPSPPPSPQVHVFRLQSASQQSGPGSGSNASAPGTVYPLCTTGWCLARLRTTCELWRFVRHGVVERVWEEEVPDLGLVQTQRAASTAKPPIPPRRRLPSTIGVGKLIGLASSALGMEKGANSKNGGSGSGAVTPTKQSAAEERLSPAPQRASDGAAGKRRISLASGTPPPLPRRNEGRVVGKVEDEKKVDELPSEKNPVAVELSPRVEVDAISTGAESVYSVDDAKVDNTLATVTDTAPAGMITQTLSAEPDEFLTPAGTPAQSPNTNAPAPNSLTEPAQIPLPDSPAVANFPDAENQGEKTPTTEAEVPAEDESTPPKAEEESTKTEDEPSAPNADGAPTTDPPATVTVPSRTASPAPPPLPRRAARRAVPPPPGGSPSPKPAADTAPEASAEEPAPPPPSHDLPPPVHPHASKAREASPARRVPPPLAPSPSPPTKAPAPAPEEEYVGDVTWEERTWKELVRLREDMFYARVGAVR